MIGEPLNPRAVRMDLESTRKVLRIIHSEDRKVPRAVAREIPRIARAVDMIVKALRQGGRLIYVGAGTSGRLGLLDAAECPPTFNTSPDMVRAVLAGGRRAVTRAVEGAEDSSSLGQRDMRRLRLSKRDVVVGLSASGNTPYTVAALALARRRGAQTVAVTTHPRSKAALLAEVSIAPVVGPEVIAGSTRMKAGTAQKLVLNMLSTAAMIRLGYTYGGWMINVRRTNRKLMRRAERILEQTTGVGTAAARRAMRRAGGNTRVALIMLKLGCPAREARRKLAEAGGELRRALGEIAR
ncbi:MAG TPA: N-acetylmuramic acid 6-phosphate etherase [Candidatus Acidoferrales bacterium]